MFKMMKNSLSLSLSCNIKKYPLLLSSLSKKMSLYAAAGILVLFPLFSAVTLTGCDGGGGGGAAENTGNDDTGGAGGGSGDTGTGDDTSGGDTGGTEPEVRIVLANASNTAAANDIEPWKIEPSSVYYNGGSQNGYGETFNTLYFEPEQFEPGKKYIFNGELDAEGKVKDRIFISGNGVVNNIDIVVNNAIFYSGHIQGNSKLTFDMPCYDSFEFEGKTVKMNPKPSLDKVPVLEADTISTEAESTIVAPIGAKKRIAGGAPDYIPPLF